MNIEIREQQIREINMLMMILGDSNTGYLVQGLVRHALEDILGNMYPNSVRKRNIEELNSLNKG